MTGENPNTNESTISGTVWKLPIVGFVSLLLVVGVSTLVFVISKRSLYDELEYTIVLIASILFVFLSIGLYTGARLQGKPAIPEFNAFRVGLAAYKIADGLDILEFLGPAVAWIAFSIAAPFILIFLATVLWSAVLALTFMLYWLVYRAIRVILLKGQRCQGNLRLSFLNAAWYSFLYSGWIFAIVWLAEHRPWQ